MGPEAGSGDEEARLCSREAEEDVLVALGSARRKTPTRVQRCRKADPPSRRTATCYVALRKIRCIKNPRTDP